MKIAVLPGDGVGKEVAAEAVKVLKAVVKAELIEAPVGGEGIKAAGDPLPDATLKICQDADAILFGAVGIANDAQLPDRERPGAGLLQLRKALGLFTNFRPAFLFPELVNASTLKPEVVEGLDILILRELTGDLYFGEPRGLIRNADGEREAFNTMRYSESEIARIARIGFEAARKRKGKLCSVDKANVLETMKLWREVVTDVGRDYPDVELTHVFVDAAVMMLMRAPTQFDVIVTGNVFGDILSDAAAMLTGSIGMLPSAALGEGNKGLYEPVHGSAPDIAGRNIANPLAAILSVEMMLRYTFDLGDAADRIRAAVRKALAQGYRTGDIFEPGMTRVGTCEMGDAVVAAL